MNDRTRTLAITLSSLLTLVVNGLSNALPLNGLTTGEISDRFQVYFVPAGYVFSIWGLIYLGLIVFNIYQLIPTQRENPRLRAIGSWVVLSNLANAAWIFLWHYQQFLLTLLAMGILLVSLLAIYLELRRGVEAPKSGERWMVRLPFSIYLGWITVATIANISDVLDYLDWNRFGLTDASWMSIILAVVILLAWAMSVRQRDAAYLGVLLWALAGIGVKFPDAGMVTWAVWVSFVLVVLAFVWALVQRRPWLAQVQS